MKTAAPILVSVAFLFTASASYVVAGPGDLDPGFDADGILETDFGSNAGAIAVLVQGDGKILAAGMLGDGTFGVARYESDGTPDTSFGNSGLATAAFGVGNEGATAALIAPDGKIVVSGGVDLSGAVAPPQRAPQSKLAIARFDTTGTLDPSFGTGGTTLTDIADGYHDWTQTMVRLPSGRLVTGGSAEFTGGPRGVLVAYDDAGALDSGFGTGGIVLTTDLGSIDGLALGTDSIVAVGSTSDGHLAVGRFAFDGTAGAVTVLADSGFFASAVAIDPVGRIVIAGGTGYCGKTRIARLNPDGTLDTQFGTMGTAVIDVSPYDGCGDSATALTLLPDGKILLAAQGTSYEPPVSIALSTWWLLRLDPDGALDPGFGSGGSVFVYDAAPASMALQRDGKVLTGGYVESYVIEPPYAIPESAMVLARNEATPTPVCSAAPRNGCAAPAAAHASTLKLTLRSAKPPTLRWRWKKGPADPSDFGDPTSSGSYGLCIYDAGAVLIATAQVEGGGLCTGEPCWRAIGTSGWQYKNSRGTVWGIDKVKLKTGDKSSIDVRGKHANLPIVPLPATLPLRVQLQSSTGSCFEAVYTSATRNDTTDFSARN